MDFLKWTIFFCMLTSVVAANLRKFNIPAAGYVIHLHFNLIVILCYCLLTALLTSSEENYVEDFNNYDDDYYGESVDDVDICTLPPINHHSTNKRRCSGFIPRWYYDAQSNSCKKFFWDGCWGTRNLFRNEFACLARCNKQGTSIKYSCHNTRFPIQKIHNLKNVIFKQDYRENWVKAMHLLRVCNRKPPALVVPRFRVIFSMCKRENARLSITADAVATATDSKRTTNAISGVIA